MAMDAGEQIEGGSWAGAGALGLQPHAHDAVEHESEEADQGVGANTVGQPLVDRGDLDVGFQHPEAALDVGQRLVARDGICRGQIGGVAIVK